MVDGVVRSARGAVFCDTLTLRAYHDDLGWNSLKLDLTIRRSVGYIDITGHSSARWVYNQDSGLKWQFSTSRPYSQKHPANYNSDTAKNCQIWRKFDVVLTKIILLVFLR